MKCPPPNTCSSTTTRSTKAPINPRVTSIDDTRNFDDFSSHVAPTLRSGPDMDKDKDWVFTGYTYKRFDNEGLSPLICNIYIYMCVCVCIMYIMYVNI